MQGINRQIYKGKYAHLGVLKLGLWMCYYKNIRIIERTIMEQNSDTSAPIAPVAGNNKQNSSKGWKITTAIASTVAICSICFGVYGMVQSSQKDKQISDLQNQTNSYSEEIVIDDEVEVESTDVDTDDNYRKFADNLAKNNEVSIFGYNGAGTVFISVKNSHLTVSDFDIDGRGGESVFAESDNIINAYLVEIGNGSVPYVYLIKKDGSVARIDISDNGTRTIEDLDGFEKIVSIFGDGDLTAHLVDINGNVFQHH